MTSQRRAFIFHRILGPADRPLSTNEIVDRCPKEEYTEEFTCPWEPGHNSIDTLSCRHARQTRMVKPSYNSIYQSLRRLEELGWVKRNNDENKQARSPTRSKCIFWTLTPTGENNLAGHTLTTLYERQRLIENLERILALPAPSGSKNKQVKRKQKQKGQQT